MISLMANRCINKITICLVATESAAAVSISQNRCVRRAVERGPSGVQQGETITDALALRLICFRRSTVSDTVISGIAVGVVYGLVRFG